MSTRFGETTVSMVAGSDVAQTLPAGEQSVNFSGTGGAASANAGAAKKANIIARQRFMGPNYR